MARQVTQEMLGVLRRHSFGSGSLDVPNRPNEFRDELKLELLQLVAEICKDQQ